MEHPSQPSPKTPAVNTPVGVFAYPREVVVVAYPNPPADEIHFTSVETGERQLGDQREAALAAGVKPGTIQVWVSRKKIEPVFTGPTGPIFHLPTIKEAAEGGAAHRHPTPWLNSQGPHAHAA